ncbi:MAG: hypothetical protein GY729_06755 [Desulfobacteraceae bacterium]|nr:hypothetical protein [Desulfobacteraceae bacterium]
MKRPPTFLINFSVFTISFCILSIEIIFTRIFAYAQWHNLSALIITLALLGFGAAGTCVSIAQKKIEKNYAFIFISGLILFPLFMASGFIISLTIDYNPYEITFNPKQVLYVFVYFFFMGIPFFIGALIICMAFLSYSVSRIYFFNMTGSAAGAMAVVGLCFAMHPCDIIVLLIFAAMLPALVISFSQKTTNKMMIWLIVGIIALCFWVSNTSLNDKKVSQYKSISYALRLPDARIVHEAYSPLGVVQVVAAKGLRSCAGLSLASAFEVPGQMGVFFNGGNMSPITPFKKGAKKKIRYLEYLSSYLPYDILDQNQKKHVLIIGSGGGESILKSLLAGFRSIDALEVNPDVISLMQNQFGQFSGNIYSKDNVRVLNHEARRYIKSTSQKYDLIDICLLDGFNAAASGVHALNESYLYTTSFIKEAYARLNEKGILALTRWVVTPARDNLKLFNIIISAFEKAENEDVGSRLIAIRSLQTITMLLSKEKIDKKTIAKLKAFCENRLFDLVYYPGITPEQANRHIQLELPVYHDAVQKLLSSQKKVFVRDYDFDISSSTDNKPYFYNFFKPKVLFYILKYGPSQIPVTEWGYLILLIILIPVAIVSTILIFLPLWVAKKRIKQQKKTVLFYFALIAVGYFFIEMPLIQKMILFLGHPTYAISLIISCLLASSGIGSLFSKRLFNLSYRIFYVSCIIVFTIGVYLLFMDHVFDYFMKFDIGVRVLVVVFMVAPLGFFMGFPFPCGMDILKQNQDSTLAWAFGINGFFSVISILVAAILAVIWGFQAVFFLAMAAYLGAGILSLKIGCHLDSCVHVR